MGNYLMNSLFSAKLMDYLFQELRLPWTSPHTKILDCETSPFNDEIGAAVYEIFMANDLDVEACYIELRKAGVADKATFGNKALTAADAYFSEGYNHASFLGYCAIVLGVATFYFAFPNNEVPDTAADVIALVLTAHQLTGQFYKHNGWDGLLRTSKEFNNITLVLKKNNFYNGTRTSEEE